MQNGIPVGLRSSPSFGLSRSGQLTAIIQSLFWDGSQGWWYDDDDLTTLFQDSAGTTPVTAVEQFVGLQLDKSKGLVLGPELVTNGTFDTDATGWTAINVQSAAPSVVSGELYISNAATATAVGAVQTLNLVVGKTYKVSGVARRQAGDYVHVTIINNAQNTFVAQGAQITSTTNTPVELIFTATETNSKIYLRGASASTNPIQGYFDNISVRELPGNHRFQSTSGSRPVWSKRVNLLTKTEQFDDAAWTKINATVTANATTAPDGTLTADLVVFSSVASNIINRSVSGSPTFLFTPSLYFKYGGVGQWFRFMWYDGTGNQVRLWFDAINGVIGTAQAAGTATYVSSAIQSVGNGWFRVSITGSQPGSSGYFQVSAQTADGSTTPANGEVYLWGADLRPANQATGLLPLYQRVNTSTDYDTNGFPGYLKADGVDDFLQTNSIDFNTVTSDGQARRNLLLNPTQFDAAAWVKARTAITANASTAPDETTTADLAVPTAVAGAHQVYFGSSTASAAPVTFSFYVKAAGYTNVQLSDAANGSFQATFDLSAVTSTGVLNSTTTISAVGNGWFRCVAAISSFAAASRPSINAYPIGATLDNFGATFTGDGTSGIYIWGAQLETGSTATAFQNIGTDKITLCAGVRKLSDAAQAVVTELSATIASNNGTFLLAAPDGATNTYGWDSKGTTQVDAVASTFTAPITNVVTGIGNISGDSAIIRVNGVVADTETGDQGTGNYGNYPVYFFHRNSPAGTRFNGYEYGNVAVGKLLTADQLTALETYMNGLTKAY